MASVASAAPSGAERRGKAIRADRKAFYLELSSGSHQEPITFTFFCPSPIPLPLSLPFLPLFLPCSLEPTFSFLSYSVFTLLSTQTNFCHLLSCFFTSREFLSPPSIHSLSSSLLYLERVLSQGIEMRDRSWSFILVWIRFLRTCGPDLPDLL